MTIIPYLLDVTERRIVPRKSADDYSITIMSISRRYSHRTIHPVSSSDHDVSNISRLPAPFPLREVGNFISLTSPKSDLQREEAYLSRSDLSCAICLG